MHFAYPSWFARVTVPSDGMCITPKIGIIQFRYHPPPIHIVMIQDPYLGGRICLFEERPQVFDDEFGLAFLGPRTRGHLTMLVSINFVLSSDGLHRHAFGSVSLQKLQKILSVRGEVLTAHGAT